MKGFMKRDFYLIKGNLKFYLIFMLIFAAAAIFTSVNTSMFAIYVVIFGVSSIMGLFNYDEFNHWMAYGAAVPEGRRAMVNARYLLAALLGLGIVAVQIILGLLAREDIVFFMAAIYAGAFLLYAAIVLPVCYRFGGTKARTVLIVIIAAMAGVGGMLGAVVSISGGGGKLHLPPIFLALPLAGAAALALSWRISTGIMLKKEF